MTLTNSLGKKLAARLLATEPDPRRHLRGATGLYMFGWWTTEAGAMAGSTVRAPRG